MSDLPQPQASPTPLQPPANRATKKEAARQRDAETAAASVISSATEVVERSKVFSRRQGHDREDEKGRAEKKVRAFTGLLQGSPIVQFDLPKWQYMYCTCEMVFRFAFVSSPGMSRALGKAAPEPIKTSLVPLL